MGTGLVVARREEDDSWSAPSAIATLSCGWGLQVCPPLYQFGVPSVGAPGMIEPRDIDPWANAHTLRSSPNITMTSRPSKPGPRALILSDSATLAEPWA